MRASARREIALVGDFVGDLGDWEVAFLSGEKESESKSWRESDRERERLT